MHQLTVGPNWASQISKIREAHSDDTNLIRFDNTFYRICRNSSDLFAILLYAGDDLGSSPLQIQVREKDFYIIELAGISMGRYASTFNFGTTSAGILNSAIHDLIGNKANGERAFSLRSLIVFCVAESIRNDQFATELDQTIRAEKMYIGGVKKELKIAPWWDLSHQWGKTSNAIHQLNPANNQHVDLSRIPLQLRRCAQTTKVLKLKE